MSDLNWAAEPGRYFGGTEETRENKSLQFLVDPPEPIVFDPTPGGADMPEPAVDHGESTPPPEGTDG